MKKLYNEDAASDQQLKQDKIQNVQDAIKIKQEELKQLQQKLSDIQNGKDISESVIIEDIVSDIKNKFKELNQFIYKTELKDNDYVQDIISSLEDSVDSLISKKELTEDGESSAMITTSSIGGTATDSSGNSITPAFNNAAYVPVKVGNVMSRYGTFTTIKNKKSKSKNEMFKYIDNKIV